MNPAPRAFSAGVVVVHRFEDGWRYLLLRCFRNWDFPKGMVEAGESPLQAARREVEEETAIADLSFDWGEEHIETGPYARGKVARYYLARAAGTDVELRVNPAIGRSEHSEFRWVDLDSALALASPRVRDVVRWASARLEGAERP
jgi:8-oxo-dGTP pyrophosphatase MutT (NUDIX family)